MKSMHSRLSKHPHINNILVTKQYGFRKGMSTVKMLPSSLTDSAFKSTDHNMHDGGIFCDLAKAFNCTIQEILFTKLHFCGIRAVS